MTIPILVYHSICDEKSNLSLNKLNFSNTMSYTGISNELYGNYNSNPNYTFFMETSNSVSTNIHKDLQLNVYHKYIG